MKNIFLFLITLIVSSGSLFADNYIVKDSLLASFKPVKDTVISSLNPNLGLGLFDGNILYYTFSSTKAYDHLISKNMNLTETKNYVALRSKIIDAKMINPSTFSLDNDKFSTIADLMDKLRHNIVSSFAFNPIDSSVVYTDLSLGNKNSILFQMKRINGKWRTRNKMTFCRKGVDYAMPTFSNDGSILYFACNDNTGNGGWDIYFSNKNEEGLWLEPINMGKGVNTKENELFPFVANNNLYFSSNGYEGFGGYDLYVKNVDDEKSGASNIGKPMNTDSDDMSMVASLDNSFLSILTSKLVDGANTNSIRFFKDTIVNFSNDVLLFDFDRAAFKDSERAKLSKKLKINNISDKSKYKLTVFASLEGSYEYNLYLSYLRQQTLKKYLNTTYGFQDNQIYSKLVGDYNADESNESRRIEFNVLADSVKAHKLRIYYRLPSSLSIKEIADLFSVKESDIYSVSKTSKINSFAKGDIVDVPIRKIIRLNKTKEVLNLIKKYSIDKEKILLLNNITSFKKNQTIIIPLSAPINNDDKFVKK